MDLYTRIHMAYKNAEEILKADIGVKSEEYMVISETNGCIYAPRAMMEEGLFRDAQRGQPGEQTVFLPVRGGRYTV